MCPGPPSRLSRSIDKPPKGWPSRVPAMPGHAWSSAHEAAHGPRDTAGSAGRGSPHPKAPGPPTAGHCGAHGGEVRRAPYRGTRCAPGERPVAPAPGYDIQGRCRPRTGRQPASGPSAVPPVAAGNALTTCRRAASAAAYSASALPPTTPFRPHPARSQQLIPHGRVGRQQEPGRHGPARAATFAESRIPCVSRGPRRPAEFLARSSNSGRLPRTPTDGELPAGGVLWQVEAPRGGGVCRPVRRAGRSGGERRGTGGGGVLRAAARTCVEGRSPTRSPHGAGGARRTRFSRDGGSRENGSHRSRSTTYHLVRGHARRDARGPGRNRRAKEPTAQRAGKGSGIHAHSSVSRGILVRGAASWKIRAIEHG